MSARGRRAGRGVLIAAVAGLAVAAIWFGQRSMYYVPDTSDPGRAADALPGGVDVDLRTADGLTLGAWFVQPEQGADVAVLYLPGNGGNRAGRAAVAQALADQGLAVLLVDYRGYGGNPGSPTEEGLALDTQAAADWLRDAGFAPERAIYLGESLGTGVATRLAVDRPPGGLVLRSPYTTFADVAVLQAGGAPIGWLIRDRYDTLATIPSVEAPVLVLAGGADALVPPQQSAAVADAAPNLVAYEEEPDVGHNDALWFGAPLAERVGAFADAVIR